MLDCLIVGGGPAGLTAAIYLARFHMKIQLVDSGDSRALWISKSHNIPGFPEGVSGADLLFKMRKQAIQYGAIIKNGRVSTISKESGKFLVDWGEGRVLARTVLLATGVVSRRPDITEEMHAEALANGRLRYCPICDGYEVTDQRVAVIGTGERGAREALFLRSYSADVSLISPGPEHVVENGFREILAGAGVTMVDGPAKIDRLLSDGIVVRCGAQHLTFASVYPALGTDVSSTLATMVGATCNETGCVKVDAHQRTSVARLYAAGDMAVGLDQISHAMGEGGVAATAIRNDLAAQAPLFR